MWYVSFYWIFLICFLRSWRKWKINSLWDVVNKLVFEILYYKNFPDSGLSIPFDTLFSSIKPCLLYGVYKEQPGWVIQFFSVFILFLNRNSLTFPPPFLPPAPPNYLPSNTSQVLPISQSLKEKQPLNFKSDWKALSSNGSSCPVVLVCGGINQWQLVCTRTPIGLIFAM